MSAERDRKKDDTLGRIKALFDGRQDGKIKGIGKEAFLEGSQSEVKITVKRGSLGEHITYTFGSKSSSFLGAEIQFDIFPGSSNLERETVYLSAEDLEQEITGEMVLRYLESIAAEEAFLQKSRKP